MDWLSASVRPMIVSDLDHTMIDHHDVENVSLLCCSIYHAQDPSAVTVHLSGVEENLHERIHELKEGKKVSGLGGLFIIYTDWFKHMAGEFQ